MQGSKWKKGMAVVAAGALCLGVGFSLTGCAAPSAPAQENALAAQEAEATHAVTLHRGYASAHGDKAFTQIVVATAEDGSILATNVDDYQFMAKDGVGVKPVPNSDLDFGTKVVGEVVLGSKADNDGYYSELMKTKAKSTQPWETSMKAIEDFTVGKMPADLTKATGPDAVSGATLVDTANYLKAISEVAKSTDLTTTGSYTGTGSDLMLGRALSAAHGKGAFCSAVSLVQGDMIVATSIDEFQFLSTTTAGLVPVPNSDKGLAESVDPAVMLASKSVNSKTYSEMIKAKGNATQEWLDSIKAIEDNVAGKTIKEVGAIAGPDAVSGATLVDTANYAKAAAAAAQAV